MQVKYIFIAVINIATSTGLSALTYPEITQMHRVFCNKVEVAYHSEIEANGGNCIVDADFNRSVCDKLRVFRTEFQDEESFAQSITFLLMLCPGQRFRLSPMEFAQYFVAIEQLTPIFYHTSNVDGRQSSAQFLSHSLLKASYELFLFRRTCNDQTALSSPSKSQIQLQLSRKSAVSSILRFVKIISGLLALHGNAQEFMVKTKAVGTELQAGLNVLFHGHHLLDHSDGLLRAVHACAVAMDYDRGDGQISLLFDALRSLFS